MDSFKEGDFFVFWSLDRSSVSISDGKTIKNFIKDNCYKLVRPEKENIVDVVKIHGSRFSGRQGKPSAIFFVPWRESKKEWSVGGRLREYSFKDMFNNTIEECLEEIEECLAELR